MSQGILETPSAVIVCVGALVPTNTQLSAIQVSASSLWDDAFDQPPAAIICNLQDSKQADEVLQSIRQAPWGAFVPLFCQTACSMRDALSDGECPMDIDEWLSLYDERQRTLKLGADTLEAKLVAYLWLHGNRRLVPVPSRTHPGEYDYPLLECWDRHTSKRYWMLELQRADIIAPSSLVNRVRQCEACDSPNLNYIDTCPRCGDIDIRQEASLHCFTCGHVAPQDEFVHRDRRVCPQCLTTLKHIGVDYDRPLEGFRCGGCRATFVEGRVVAQCFNCNIINELDRLKQVHYHAFSLADGGRALAKTGELRSIIPDNLLDSVSTDHFVWMVEWLFNYGKRLPQPHSVLVIAFANLTECLQLYSEAAVLNHLDECIRRITNTLRKTDVACLYKTNALYFILPSTAVDHIETMVRKINSVYDGQQESMLDIRVSMDDIEHLSSEPNTRQWLDALYDRALV